MKVYVSYTRSDGRDIDDAVAEGLRSLGHDALAEIGVSPHEPIWVERSGEVLSSIDAYVAIITQASEKSRIGKSLTAYAIFLNRPVIVFHAHADATIPLSKDIPKLPYHLHGFHYVVLDDDLSTIEDDIITAIENISNDDIWQ